MTKKKTEQVNDDEGLMVVMFFLGLIVASAVWIFIYYCVIVDNPIDDLDLDKNQIAREYVLIHYPEYQNCSIEWDSYIRNSGWNVEGVNIYCGEVYNRDGLEVIRENEPTIQIAFEDVTLEEAFKVVWERNL